MINVLFAGLPKRWADYEPHLIRAFETAGLDVDLRHDFAPDQVDYIVYAPNGPVQDFTPYTRAKAVLNLWAGVEAIVGNPTLNIPLCRMVDPGLTEGMVEWVTGHTLRYHLDMDHWVATQDGSWTPKVPPLARERQVTVLGLGALGAACAQALTGLNFHVTGWSRTQKDIPGVACLSGQDGLHRALSTAEIVILLLPNTPATENMLNAETFARLPKGARIINPGRGPLINDADLLDALNSGQIAHATLDVFRVEPLPKDHPYWVHPNVTVTPHIAADTRAVTAVDLIAENIRRGEAAEPLLHQVDRQLGY